MGIHTKRQLPDVADQLTLSLHWMKLNRNTNSIINNFFDVFFLLLSSSWQQNIYLFKKIKKA